MLKRYWYDDAFSAVKRNAGKTLTACYALEAFEMFQKVEDSKQDDKKGWGIPDETMDAHDYEDN